MVLWSAGFLLLGLHLLKECLGEWKTNKSLWVGFKITLFSGCVLVYLLDIYLGRAPAIVTIFL